ncbi:MAG: TMEM165/GDT1 family protein, partial [Steroidobacter sp.]
MHAFLVSTGIVALSEMGDKTQLLALLLATRFRKPLPIIAGIFASTIINHLGAGALGDWLMHVLGANVLRWILGCSFLGMAAWVLIPDKMDDTAPPASQHSVFITTVIAFFLAEMGDKTQVATIALAAHYGSL